MGRVVRVTDPEGAVRLFEAGMLYWHFTPSNALLPVTTWSASDIRCEVRNHTRHRLSYIVEDEEGDSPTTESED